MSARRGSPRADGGEHGVVLTRPHVAALMLDLAGYTVERPLERMRLLEPACGEGVFVVAAIRRLARARQRAGCAWAELGGAIEAWDIRAEHVQRTRAAVIEELTALGAAPAVARALAQRYVRHGDFLLAPVEAAPDVIVGNPPYVRIEQLAPALQAAYRRRFTTLYDRADLYVAFFERALRLLGDHGVLVFVCADRWLRNRYGAALRQMITTGFRVTAVIDLHEAAPFESNVSAYPAIIGLARGNGATRVPVVRLASASPEECRVVLPLAPTAPRMAHAGVQRDEYPQWFAGSEPWILTSSRHLALLRDLEARFPTLEADGATRVGIGVATGRDDVYIVPADLPIERDRLVPLVMREDVERGRIRDARRAVIDTFAPDGRPIDLARYPRLAAYLEAHGAAVRARRIAAKGVWFRTIDRVQPRLARQPKLLIPDIAGSCQVVFEQGRFHPHHNLYFVTSTAWDLEVLGGLLSSRVALFFVWSYGVKMRGGYLRFQAQYLRRIRVPATASIDASLAAALGGAFRARDFAALDRLALQAYGIAEVPEFAFIDTRT